MFDELEERLREVLAALRGAPLAPAPAGGRIIREVADPDFLARQLEVIPAVGERQPEVYALPPWASSLCPCIA